MLVTDAEERSTLAACRGLARAGYRVTAVAGSKPAASHWSRSCRRRLTLPDPRHDPEAFLRGLQTILEEEPHAILLASTDVTTSLISEHRERFEGLVELALPDRDAVRASLDKSRLAVAAAAVGLAGPASVLCAGFDEGLSAATELGFPVIVKSTRSFVPTVGGFRQRAVKLVTDPARLEAALAGLDLPFIVQRYVPNSRIVSCSGVMTPGGLRGFAVVRWQRRWPVAEGATSFCRTIAPPEGLAEKVQELLASLRFWGIFELELLEASDGQLMAIDFNPRLFGWLSLPIAAGANFPALFCDWLGGLDPAPVEARSGVYYRWEDADVRHFFWQLGKGRLGAAAAVLRPRRRVVHAHFELRDPGPLFARAILLLRTLLRGRPEPTVVDPTLVAEPTRTGAPV